MLDNKFADELTGVATGQLTDGLKAKKPRMKIVAEIEDLCNNKVIGMDDDVINIPFPFLASHIDLLYSKIDNPPTLEFKIPNRRETSAKVKSAWMQEMNSTRAGWKRKDRVEKKMALKTGRAVSKHYASSFQGKYKSHYDIVDIYSFVADPAHGDLNVGNYHGETDIFKTNAYMKQMAKLGVYDKGQVQKLVNNAKPTDASADVMKHKFDRLKATGVDISLSSFAGQKGTNLTEWIMRYEEEMYYLLFDPKTGIWVRAERLRDVFLNNKTPYVSWATHYDEYNFWSKGPADDFYPVAESMRLLLNTALENEKRRTRPMRVVDSGALLDVNELQDYVPDNVILRNPGRDPNIVTIETPEVSGTINLVQYLDNTMQSKSGVSEPGVEEKDAKVGVYYGKLAQEADRIGTINKEYSESYAFKGYLFFWGLKEHLRSTKQIEMLGKSGIKLQELSQYDLKDVDDVDDVLVTGGSEQAELTAIENNQQLQILTEVGASYGQMLNPKATVREILKRANFEDDIIEELLDVENGVNRESVEDADEAIQSVLLGRNLKLNMSADTDYARRIINYVQENLDYVKIDSEGNEIGIDQKVKKQAEKLLAHVKAHAEIIQRNMQNKLREMQIKQMGMQIEGGEQQQQNPGQVDLPKQTEAQQQQALAQPFEGTQGGTLSQSQNITQALG